MGRRIFENDNFIWKYAFAIQPSEQSKIFNNYGIGNLSYMIDFPCDYIHECRKCPYPNHCKDLIKYKKYNNIKNDEKLYIIGDVLTLESTDIPSLKKILKTNNSNYKQAKDIEKTYYSKYGHDNYIPSKIYDEMNNEIFEMCPNFYFNGMLESFIKYIQRENKYHNRTIFNFKGDLI